MLRARIAALLGCLLTACAALILIPANAHAHPLSTTAVLLDIGPDQVRGQIQLPIDRLAIALDTLTVPAQTPAGVSGFFAAVRLGIQHIAEGADHLLFLLMLLLPAPLLAARGRWTRADDLRRQTWRTLHVVTAFAFGHSLTLALAALGYVTVPTRIVEGLIALSILVSGVHALRPIVRGGEVWIAAGFGLMHGLAFAALLGQLDLSRSSLIVELLGFNLGIELTQLIVVALVMPSLIVLSRSHVYPAVRTGLAGVGVVLAAGWLAERTTLIEANPFEPLSTALVEHPFTVPAALALTAVTTLALRRRTLAKMSRCSSPEPQPR